MKKICLAMLVLSILFISASAFADSYTVTSIGDFDFVSGSSGYSGTGTRIGSFYFYNDNR